MLGGPEALGRVMRNLVDNAIRHAPAASHVVVRVRNGDGATVEVIDDGPGFDPDLLPAAFETFSRADLSRSRDTGGAGLGLAIAKGVIEAHGGERLGRRRTRRPSRLPAPDHLLTGRQNRHRRSRRRRPGGDRLPMERSPDVLTAITSCSSLLAPSCRRGSSGLEEWWSWLATRPGRALGGVDDRAVVGDRSRDGSADGARVADVLAVAGHGGGAGDGCRDAFVRVLHGAAAFPRLHVGRVGDRGAGGWRRHRVQRGDGADADGSAR